MTAEEEDSNSQDFNIHTDHGHLAWNCLMKIVTLAVKALVIPPGIPFPQFHPSGTPHFTVLPTSCHFNSYVLILCCSSPHLWLGKILWFGVQYNRAGWWGQSRDTPCAPPLDSEP